MVVPVQNCFASLEGLLWLPLITWWQKKTIQQTKTLSEHNKYSKDLISYSQLLK